MGIIADLFKKPKYGIIFTGLGIDKIHKTQYDTKVAAHFSAIQVIEEYK